MRKFFFVILLFLFSLVLNCATPGPYSSIPAGEIKISYFSITEGLKGKETVGSYVAMISPKWLQNYKKDLKEPFEALNLPPNQPAIKIAPDEVILELVALLEKEGFYSLKSVSLKKYSPETLSLPSFQARVLTIERNGFSYSITPENLPDNLKQTFFWLKNIFLKNYYELESWSTETGYNWDDFIKTQIKKKK